MNEKNNIVHTKSFDIAWGDMDALGHVNNGKYFDYFQEARIEWLSTLDLNLKSQYGPVVIHVSATFHKPITYPAHIEIISRLDSIGRSSMLMHHSIHQNDTLMAEGTSKIVWVDYQKNKSHPIPDKIRELI